MYAPIYSYTFNGEYIEEAFSTLYTSRKPEIGAIEEIAIDSEKPEVPIVKSKYTSMIMVGIPFIAMLIFIIPMLLQSST